MKTVKIYMVRKPSDIDEVKELCRRYNNQAEEVTVAETVNLPPVWYGAVCRATGVTLTHLTYGEVQQSLFEKVKPHDDKLSHLVDELEAKFGKGIVKTGV